MPTPTIGQTLHATQHALATTPTLSATQARIEAAMLLCRALGQPSRAWLIAHETDSISPAHQAALHALLQRRLAGEPMAYLLGEREFYGLNFKVTPAVLIPRPETELLVELALQHLPPQGRVLDLGTGSGAVALAIAHTRADAEVWAVDVSAAALAVAQENARHLQLGHVRFIESDWFTRLPPIQFNLIVANPPYIAAADPHLTQGDLRFEPSRALISGADGLADIRHLILASREYLVANGWLLFEHGYNQAEQARALLLQAGYGEISSARDLAGIERVSGGAAKMH
jgi:release factor glutamine methyltransferase